MASECGTCSSMVRGVGEAGEANYVLALSALAPVQHKDERMKWKWVWVRERALAWQWKWSGQGEGVGAGRKSAAWGWKSEDKHEVKDVSFKRCPRERGKARQGEVQVACGEAKRRQRQMESQADWVGRAGRLLLLLCSRLGTQKLCHTAMQGKVNYGSCCCCCRCCCCLCACCAVAPKSEIKIK